jgi:hypothetical protein
MSRTVVVLLLAEVLVTFTPLEAGQVSPSHEDLVRALLNIPAPTPRFHAQESPAASATPQSRNSFAEPPDEAPLEVLARYWSQMDRDARPNSDKVRQRLLEACEAQPEYLPRLVNHLPATPVAQERIKAIFDREQLSPHLGSEWQADIKRYLMYHSRYFLPELVRAAQAAHDDDASPVGEEDLRAIAALDWPSAEPILKSHAASTNPRVGSVSLALLYEHSQTAGAASEAAAYRSRLKGLVEDRSAAGRARDTAAEALLTMAWEGRDHWYWGLFKDPTLRELRDGYMMMTPLSHVDMATDKWDRGIGASRGFSRSRGARCGRVLPGGISA